MCGGSVLAIFLPGSSRGERYSRKSRFHSGYEILLLSRPVPSPPLLPFWHEKNFHHFCFSAPAEIPGNFFVLTCRRFTQYLESCSLGECTTTGNATEKNQIDRLNCATASMTSFGVSMARTASARSENASS